jgi:hypothetical protein
MVLRFRDFRKKVKKACWNANAQFGHYKHLRDSFVADSPILQFSHTCWSVFCIELLNFFLSRLFFPKEYVVQRRFPFSAGRQNVNASGEVLKVCVFV